MDTMSDTLENIKTIFETREEVYLQFTKQVWDMIPNVRKAINESLRLETPNLFHGCSWECVDMGLIKDVGLLLKIKVAIAPGKYEFDGQEVNVTEENQQYYDMSLNYAIPLNLIAVGDYTVILAYIQEKIAENAAAKEEASAELAGLVQELTDGDQPEPEIRIDEGFDMSELTPEQRLSFELHTKTKQ